MLQNAKQYSDLLKFYSADSEIAPPNLPIDNDAQAAGNLIRRLSFMHPVHSICDVLIPSKGSAPVITSAHFAVPVQRI